MRSLRDIKASLTKSEPVEEDDDDVLPVIWRPPLWKQTTDDRKDAAINRISANSNLYARLSEEVKTLPYHGYADAALTQRICCKCLKTVDVAKGCCRWRAIWVCFDCWDRMVVANMTFPPVGVGPGTAIVRPRFARQGGHLGAVEDL